MAAAPVEAERALAMGLINRLVAPDELQGAARALCGRIAEGAPLALMKANEAMVRASGRDLSQAFAIEEECQAVVLVSQALWIDLRKRVLGAIDAGASC